MNELKKAKQRWSSHMPPPALGATFFIDEQGRVRAGVCPVGCVPFEGMATAPHGDDDWAFERFRGTANVSSAGDVATVFRDISTASKKHLWALYCEHDGTPICVEQVGLGSHDSQWSARSVFQWPVDRGVRRMSMVSNYFICPAEPPSELDLAQRQMFDRAAGVLGITIDHHVFVGLDGFSELLATGDLVARGWEDAPKPKRKIPVIEGRVRDADPSPPRFREIIEHPMPSVDGAESVARSLLSPDERVALAVLQTTYHGKITGVFPIACENWLDEDSARVAFLAGIGGFCHRIVILASGAGEDWEGRIEKYFGSPFLDWIEETYLLKSMTLLVQPGGRRVWGSLEK